MKRAISFFLALLTVLLISAPVYAYGRQSVTMLVDVPKGSWYYSAVKWALEKGITTGTDATHFSPNRCCTRAEAVTFIWRSFGCPEPKTTQCPFRDVQKSSYYFKAVLWAVENKVTTGTSLNRFSPSGYVTRGQVATFLFRITAQQRKWTAEKLEQDKALLMGWIQNQPQYSFEDVPFSAYYGHAVYALERWGIVSGVSSSPHLFAPNRICTRAEIVQMLYGYWNYNWS